MRRYGRRKTEGLGEKTCPSAIFSHHNAHMHMNGTMGRQKEKNNVLNINQTFIFVYFSPGLMINHHIKYISATSHILEMNFPSEKLLLVASRKYVCSFLTCPSVDSECSP